LSYTILRGSENSTLYSLAAQFVEPYEAVCCSLMEQILQATPSLHLIVDINDISKALTVKGVFTYNPKGEALLCCLPFQDQWVKNSLIKFFKNKTVFCISGAKPYVDFLYVVLCKVKHKSASEVREMLFMKHDGFTFNTISGDIRQCTIGMIECVMPMQMDYMQVEVMPEHTRPHPAAERLHLERCIKNNEVFVLFDDKRIVSKIHINAKSSHYIQIGGVYTLKDYRSKGYARNLVSFLVNYSRENRKETVLFVKPDNLSAIKCYQKAGFVITGKYSIVYYL